MDNTFCADTITKHIGISSDFVGTTSIDLQDYPDVVAKTLGGSVAEVLSGLENKSVSIRTFGNADSMSVSFNGTSCVLNISKGINLVEDKLIGLEISNSNGRLVLQVEVSNGKFPNIPLKKSLTRGVTSLPLIRLVQLKMHTCLGISEAVFQLPNNARLSPNSTDAVIKPLFLTAEGKAHVIARLAHYYCNKQSFTMRVSNGYTYYEDVTVSTGWQDYVGDIPLAFSDGRTELLSFTYL